MCFLWMQWRLAWNNRKRQSSCIERITSAWKSFVWWLLHWCYSINLNIMIILNHFKDSIYYFFHFLNLKKDKRLLLKIKFQTIKEILKLMFTKNIIYLFIYFPKNKNIQNTKFWLIKTTSWLVQINKTSKDFLIAALKMN